MSSSPDYDQKSSDFNGLGLGSSFETMQPRPIRNGKDFPIKYFKRHPPACQCFSKLNGGAFRILVDCAEPLPRREESISGTGKEYFRKSIFQIQKIDREKDLLYNIKKRSCGYAWSDRWGHRGVTL